MFRKSLFILAHEVRDINFYSTYKRLAKNQWKGYQQLKEEQEKQLRVMIDFVYKNVPYYHKLFNNLKLLPKDVKKVEDLEKLPILTKDIIRQNWEDFKPVNLTRMKYYLQSTGGSTGTPFKYRLSKVDGFLSRAVLYRGWGYAGYNLGDRIVFMGGSSIIPDIKHSFKKMLYRTTRNACMLSSYDMGEKEMREYVSVINSFGPKFIRGYPSSIYFFAKWIEKNNMEIYSPWAVFTTSEKLFPETREKIETVFDCNVYDTYGLNDGGISAFECPEHSGLHIDTERAVMEIVDENGQQLKKNEGKVLATILHNYAMPFIRYDTGDLGHITDEVCGCGRGYKLLEKIGGRSTDILMTPEGKNVHGWFFLYIFWKYGKGIREYQVIQEKINRIMITIVPEDGFDERLLDKIQKSIKSKSDNWNVEFKFVDKIERTGAGKYKFIVNKILSTKNRV